MRRQREQRADHTDGNLYVLLQVQPHEYFRRDEDDIILDLPLNFAQAALGDELTVPTIDGAASLKIPAGTQTGRIFELRGKGVPHLRGGGRGDQIVRVRVVTPTELTSEQKRLFKELSMCPTKRIFASAISICVDGNV